MLLSVAFDICFEIFKHCAYLVGVVSDSYAVKLTVYHIAKITLVVVLFAESLSFEESKAVTDARAQAAQAQPAVAVAPAPVEG